MAIRGHYLIVVATVLFPLTMIITFSLAVAFDHVYPVMPFMSYTGDLPIESCFFSLGLNFLAVLYTVINFIRFNQVIKFCEYESPPYDHSILRMNRISLFWGIASAMGLSITGSFQEVYTPTFHRFGALICTYCGFIYFWYQTVISEIVVEKLNSQKISGIRTILSFLSTIIHVIAPVLVIILDTTYPRCHEETLTWSKDEEGWHLHVCCSFLEWSIFFINVTYVATFYEEFKCILVKSDEIVIESFPCTPVRCDSSETTSRKNGSRRTSKVCENKKPEEPDSAKRLQCSRETETPKKKKCWRIFLRDTYKNQDSDSSKKKNPEGNDKFGYLSYPDKRRSSSQSNKQNEPPEKKHSNTPSYKQNESSEKKHSTTPSYKQNESSEKKHSTTPSNKQIESPEKKPTTTQANRQVDSPEKKPTTTQANRQVDSPEKKPTTTQANRQVDSPEKKPTTTQANKQTDSSGTSKRPDTSERRVSLKDSDVVSRSPRRKSNDISDQGLIKDTDTPDRQKPTKSSETSQKRGQPEKSVKPSETQEKFDPQKYWEIEKIGLPKEQDSAKKEISRKPTTPRKLNSDLDASMESESDILFKTQVSSSRAESRRNILAPDKFDSYKGVDSPKRIRSGNNKTLENIQKSESNQQQWGNQKKSNGTQRIGSNRKLEQNDSQVSQETTPPPPPPTSSKKNSKKKNNKKNN